jgi:peroxiredoxin
MIMRTLIIALLFTAGFIGSVVAEGIDIGPPVGAPIPAPFKVYDSVGTMSDYADLAGPSGAVLVFVRSASWCPYCIQQLRDIQSVAEPLSRRGYRLVSISYDAPEVLAGFAKKYGVTYKMTSDKGSAMIDAFGIRDPQYKEGSRAYGVPKPGIFIVDRKGIVRAKLAEEGYKVRPPSEAIIAAVNALHAP